MDRNPIGYFSLEFALHESLTIYSGGLGVLAGDHLKAASDLGVPIVAIGLLYYEGYFSQYLNADGWQQESYPHINPNRLPIALAKTPDGHPVEVKVRINGGELTVRAWKVEVGTVPLYLLDTNIEANAPAYRSITSRLYGGDHHIRIQQEIVLGIGGLRVLRALGIEPQVYHMNEGHSACLSLEQMRRLMTEQNLSFPEALRGVRSANLFTTHTPVPAGNDSFPKELIEQYFTSYAHELGITVDKLLALGRVHPDRRDEPFSMPALALRASASANGVSELHGHVSRKMWHEMWPGLPVDESPIRSITNGIHTSTWASREVADLFDRYLGPAWREHSALPDAWSAVNQIPDEELWRLRSRLRSQMVSFCRRRIRAQLLRRGAGRTELEHARNVLNPDALTIGFARRFATYKRATMLLQDLSRLCRLISSPDRPVQFIFAGKAHPADHQGKEFIQRLIHAEHHPELKGKFIFVEDYDVNVAAHIVQGVDVWLNTPRRPLEASGTSGMKAAINGGINLSVLDGWWCEAYDGANGWSIGQGEEYDDSYYHDQVESRSLYDLLEREVIPLFYERNEAGYPVEWLRVVKHSIRTIAPKFSASRMVADYALKFYAPLAKKHQGVVSDRFEHVRSQSKQISRFKDHWHQIAITDVDGSKSEQLALGADVPIAVTAQLGPFSPEEVAVEVRYGSLDVTQELLDSSVRRLSTWVNLSQPGQYQFKGTLPAQEAGTFGFSIRIVPVIDNAVERDVPGLITWWD